MVPDRNWIAFELVLGPHFKPVVWTADSTTGGDLVRVSPPGVNGGDHPDYSPDGQWITLRTENGVPGLAKLLMAHTDGTGLRILLDGSNRQRFFSSGFSPDGTGSRSASHRASARTETPTCSSDNSTSHMRVTSLTDVTNTDIWESSPRWGTAPLLH